jgi:hypothetical protein
MSEYEFYCKIDGRELQAYEVNSGPSRCHAVRGDADCKTCGNLRILTPDCQGPEEVCSNCDSRLDHEAHGSLCGLCYHELYLPMLEDSA